MHALISATQPKVSFSLCKTRFLSQIDWTEAALVSFVDSSTLFFFWSELIFNGPNPNPKGALCTVLLDTLTKKARHDLRMK